MDESSPRWTLIVGLIASVAIHLGAVALVVAAPDQAEGYLSLSPPAPPDPNDDEDEVTLGIEESDAVTLNWIGYDEYLKHIARPSDIDQAAMSPQPSAATPQVTQPEPIPTPEPPADEQAPDSSEVAESPRALPSMVASDTVDDPEAEIIEEAEETKVEDKILEVVEDATPAEEMEIETFEPKETPEATEKPESKQEDQARPPTESQSQPTEQTNQAATPSENPTEPADPADKEAQAFSIEKAPVAQPGRPLAAQGLNIRTTVPRWTHYTQMTSRPRDPVVEIYFNRQGRVQRVVMIRDAGRADVNEPLLDALYNWRATGKKLRELPPDEPGKPPQTIKVVLRISLRN